MDGAGSAPSLPRPPLLLRDALHAARHADLRNWWYTADDNLFLHLWRNAPHELLLLPHDNNFTAELEHFVRQLHHDEQAEWRAFLNSPDAQGTAATAPAAELLPALCKTVLYEVHEVLDYVASQTDVLPVLKSMPLRSRDSLCEWLQRRSGLQPWLVSLALRGTSIFTWAPDATQLQHATALLEFLVLRVSDPEELLGGSSWLAVAARIAALLADVEHERRGGGNTNTFAVVVADLGATMQSRLECGLQPTEWAAIRARPWFCTHGPPGVSHDDGMTIDWASLKKDILLSILGLTPDSIPARIDPRTVFAAAHVCTAWRAAIFGASAASWAAVCANILLPPPLLDAPRGVLPRSTLLAHHLLLCLMRSAARVMEARRAEVEQHSWRRRESQGRTIKELSRGVDDPLALLRYQVSHNTGGGEVIISTMATMAPWPCGPAAGALVAFDFETVVGPPHALDLYPFRAPHARLGSPLGGPPAILHGDVDPVSGSIGHGILPPVQWSPALSHITLALHIHCALGEPPACPRDGFQQESAELACARAQAHGVLSLRSAMDNARELLGNDAAGEPRDWPSLPQVVSLMAPHPKLCASLRDALCGVLYPTDWPAEGEQGMRVETLRCALWVTCEMPAREALLRLLRWSRTLVYIASGRLASLDVPSHLEAALAAELASAQPPAMYWPQPADEVAAVAATCSQPKRLSACRFDLWHPRGVNASRAQETCQRDHDALVAAETAWLLATGASAADGDGVTPSPAARDSAAASCLRIPPLARAWSPLAVTQPGCEEDVELDAEEEPSPPGSRRHDNQRAALEESLARHTLPMRRLVLAELVALSARVEEPRVLGADMVLLHALSKAAGVGVAEQVLRAAALDRDADDRRACRSVSQFVGLI